MSENFSILEEETRHPELHLHDFTFTETLKSDII